MESVEFMAISNNCAELLKQVIVANQVKTVVEFGSGRSTVVMDELGVNVTAYETIDEYGEEVRGRLRGTSKIVSWNGLELSDSASYDMAFIDGPSGKSSRGSAFISVAKMRPKLVVVHDISSPYIKNFVNKYLSEDYKVMNVLKEDDPNESDTAVLSLHIGCDLGTLYKIAIAVPVADTVLPLAYFNHIHCFGEWSKKHNTIFLGLSGVKITAARNILVSQAITTGASHLLFIDADHILPIDLLDKLVENASSAMVSGLICKRGYPYQTVAFRFNSKGQLDQLMLDPKDEVISVDACAMGCTLINLQQLKLLNLPYFTDGHFRHDLNLCMKFKSELGASIKVDCRVEVGHLCMPNIVYPSSSNLLRQRVMDFDASKVKT